MTVPTEEILMAHDNPNENGLANDVYFCILLKRKPCEAC